MNDATAKTNQLKLEMWCKTHPTTNESEWFISCEVPAINGREFFLFVIATPVFRANVKWTDVLWLRIRRIYSVIENFINESTQFRGVRKEIVTALRAKTFSFDSFCFDFVFHANSTKVKWTKTIAKPLRFGFSGSCSILHLGHIFLILSQFSRIQFQSN